MRLPQWDVESIRFRGALSHAPRVSAFRPVSRFEGRASALFRVLVKMKRQPVVRSIHDDLLNKVFVAFSQGGSAGADIAKHTGYRDSRQAPMFRETIADGLSCRLREARWCFVHHLILLESQKYARKIGCVDKERTGFSNVAAYEG